MRFREKLVATLRAVGPLFEEDGVLVVGSEVPNLLEPDAASTLVVSQAVDLGIDVRHHAQIKLRLRELVGFAPSPAEPSVWIPTQPGMLEVNFVGIDSSLADPTDAYPFEDDLLPLLVFGGLSFTLPPKWGIVDGLRIPTSNPGGLLLEKLLTERTGEKGDRDLLVVVGLLHTTTAAELDDFVSLFLGLTREHQASVRSNLTLTSLMPGLPGMPDPGSMRERVARLLERLNAGGGHA